MKRGLLDVTNIIAFNTNHTANWFDQLKSFITEVDGKLILDVVPAFCTVLRRGDFEFLVGQVLYHFAVHLDRFLGRGLQAGKVHSPSVCDAQWCNDGIHSHGEEADMYSARYVHSSIDTLQDKTEFCISMDNGQINKLPLHDTLIGVANTVVLACPNVSFILPCNCNDGTSLVN